MELEQHIDKQSFLRVGLIGDPVAHSYSPRFQQAAFDACGIPARYELWQTGESELPARVASLLVPQSLGANITIPYKEAVLPLLDVVDPLATRIGAVNTIVHRNEYLYGYNTDAPGLLHALLELGVGKLREPHYLAALQGDNRLNTKDAFSFAGYTAVLLGAGGAARGAAFALVNASVERLMTSLIINATPVGMHVADKEGNREAENASPMPAEVLARFAPDTVVFDMVYNPTQSQLLCQARTLGLRAVNGLSMLLHQGALAFTLWTGRPAPLEVMRSTLL